MRTPLTLTAVLGTAAALLAGCGSSTSTASGVQPAPSAGPTATTVAAAPTTSSTTTAASTTTGPLPAALNTKPTVTVPSGPAPKKLIVKDLIKGTGAAAKPGSMVTVQYVGVLYKNGKQFDASWNDGSGKPTSLALAQTIQGWQQGIPGMRIGGRRELIVPATLGYGATGSPPKIPPNSALVFVIDLHAIS
jgi:peptidylprolyl isomerase